MMNSRVIGRAWSSQGITPHSSAMCITPTVIPIARIPATTMFTLTLTTRRS